MTMEVDLGPNDTLELEIRLTHRAQRLAPIVVEATPDQPTGKMEEFERHRKMGFGQFLDRVALAKWDPLPVSAALRRLPNVTLRPRLWSCGGGFAAAAGRGGHHEEACAHGPGCYLAVFVDGVRRWTPGDPGPPDIDEFSAAGLEAVEIYRGPGEMPAELSGTGTECGAILFWTRTGDVRE